jgi:dethiobiotin synthetase
VSKKIIFVTGTDTGVGKTVFTAMLLQHLRSHGVRALAMKPFCSGGRGDVRLLQSLQKGELADEEMNPFYFKAPLAPMIAARKEKRVIQLRDVLKRIRAVEKRCECLIVEGAGGLLVPLGEGFTVANLIEKLQCAVVVVSRNKLGTINHTCLTVKVLRDLGKMPLNVILMEQKRGDLATRTNKQAMEEMLKGVQVVSVSFLGAKPKRVGRIKAAAKHLKPRLLGFFQEGGLPQMDAQVKENERNTLKIKTERKVKAAPHDFR